MADAPLRFVSLARERAPRLVQYADRDGAVWATRGRRVLRRDGGRWRTVARFPRVPSLDLLGRGRIAGRILRSDRAVVRPLRDGLLGIRDRGVWSLRGEPRLLATMRGRSVLHGCLAEDDEGSIYFGEYWMNPERADVRIFRVDPAGRRCDVAWTFEPGTHRHVHGVFRDPYEPETLWVSTGDYDGECYLYRTTDRFQTLDRVGDGTQDWRAVQLFFTPTHVSWVTDSPVSANHACRMRRSDGAFERGQPVSAPAWYGVQTTDGLMLCGLTAEDGEGVHRDDAVLLASRDGWTWQELRAWPRDRWRPGSVFRYGTIMFAAGPQRSDELWLSGLAVRGLDGRTIRFAVEGA